MFGASNTTFGGFNPNNQQPQQQQQQQQQQQPAGGLFGGAPANTQFNGKNRSSFSSLAEALPPSCSPN
jgi:hypothetical protein